CRRRGRARGDRPVALLLEQGRQLRPAAARTRRRGRLRPAGGAPLPAHRAVPALAPRPGPGVVHPRADRPGEGIRPGPGPRGLKVPAREPWWSPDRCRAAAAAGSLRLDAVAVGVPVAGDLLARLHPGRLAGHLRVVRGEVQLTEATLAYIGVPQRDRGINITGGGVHV